MNQHFAAQSFYCTTHFTAFLSFLASTAEIQSSKPTNSKHDSERPLIPALRLLDRPSQKKLLSYIALIQKEHFYGFDVGIQKGKK